MRQGSEYASAGIYGKIQNNPGFPVCQVSAYASVTRRSEYALIWLNNGLWQNSEYAWSTFYRILHKSPVLNMPGFKIWQSCESARVTKGTEYV